MRKEFPFSWYVPALLFPLALMIISGERVFSGAGHDTFGIGVMTKWEAVGASNLDMFIFINVLLAAMIVAGVAKYLRHRDEKSLLKKYGSKKDESQT